MEVKVEEKENGDRLITITYRPSAFKVIYKEHLAYAFGMDVDKVEKDLVISKCNLVIRLKADNMLSSYRISYSYNEPTYYGTVVVRASAETLYTAYGKKADVTVTPPKNYQDFDEMK